MSNQVIIFCKGLPGSGKTTWAKEVCKLNSDFIRINKDDIREILGNPTYSYEVEEKVLEIERLIGNTILSLGKSLIVDDTNFSKKHWDYWSQIAQKNSIIINELNFDVNYEECIRRDAKREKSVGRDVILSMYEKYVKNNNS